MEKIEIKARKNGPYKMIGTATYVDKNGQLQKTAGKDIALCRCGQSATKPFCDGSHRHTNFEAPLLYLHLEINNNE